MPEFDTVIVGGGHNGLICGSYLARAGLKVCVVERRPMVGGAAVTESLWPGYQVSRASYVPGLSDRILKDLELEKFGYRTGRLDPHNFAPFPSGKYLLIHQSEERTVQEIAKFSKKDAAAFPKFSRFLTQFAETVEPLLLSPPPVLTDLLELFDGTEFEDIVRQILMTSESELLESTFESEEIKGALAMHGILNTSMGPDVIGTSYILAIALGSKHYHFAKGGTGAVSKALAASFTASGGVILLDTEVKRIVVNGNRATGIELATGKIISAGLVASNADPKRTFLKLVGAENLDSEFAARIENLRAYGTSFKINLALDGPLDFAALPGRDIGPQHKAMTDIAPSIDYIQKAYDEAKWGRIPAEPPLSMFCQTAWDPSVAPPGKHTLSVIAKFNPYKLREGHWDDLKEKALENALTVLEAYAPGVRRQILHTDALSPLDLERVFAITEGNVTHLDQTLNQMLSFRPLVGWAQYRTPVDGLYLCGSGTHPGGGVRGFPGHNAAHAILEDLHRTS